LACRDELRSAAPRFRSPLTLLRLGAAAAFVLVGFVTSTTSASASTGCKSVGYACTIGGYNATSMNNSWAAKYYGSDTKGGIGTPPHNCTLYAAWMLARNGLSDPGRTWGYGYQWGITLAHETNQTPAVGAIAWYNGPGMGHVAYVARVNWSNHTVFLVSDNYAGGVDGYTSSTWAPFTQATGYIHMHDLSAPLPLAARRIRVRS
jgi:surface antigen